MSYFLDRPGHTAALIGSAVLVAAVAFLAPAAWRLFFRLWMRAATALGRLLSVAVLCVGFYLVVAPVGLVLRLFGRRPLDTDWKNRRASYWKEKPEGTFTVARYEKQF